MKKPIGRPRTKVNLTAKKRVAILAGMNFSHDEIAVELGVSRGTLEATYAAELSEGAIRARCRIACAVFTAAERGNMPAARYVLSIVPSPVLPPEPLPERGSAWGTRNARATRAAVDAAKGTDWEGLLVPIHRLPGV